MNFFSEMEKKQISTTENGAKGFKTTGSKLVDLNFRIPSFRRYGNIPFDLFQLSYEQEANLTLRWLLYLRDIKQGCGERDSFRKFLTYLCDHNPVIGSKFLKEFVKGDYGRWDDVIEIYFSTKSKEIKHDIKNILSEQLFRDMDALHPSLLAKWLPSESSKNLVTRQRARKLATEVFGCSSRVYRKTLSSLRKYVAPTEVFTSAGKWEEVLYQDVPSKANLKYKSAFLKHDYDRRMSYLDDVASNKVKINANSMFLHDIVLAYSNSYEPNITLEALWKNQEKPINFADTLVVHDSSGSMAQYVSESSNLTASIIASALTIYCAENNTGIYHNKFLTFSSKPRCVSFPEQSNLFEKLSQLRSMHENFFSTNIEAVFDLILSTAVKNKAKTDEIPTNILIISDMEFDEAVQNSESTLFEHISKKFKEAGYKLPKLIFWNVCSRTNTIPMVANEEGVILLSGFSKNLLTMVMSSELDPYKALVKMLNSKRYSCIDKVYPL